MVPVTQFDVLKFESHPGKTLKAHTNGVCDIATAIFNMARVPSLLHDGGKWINGINFGAKLAQQNVTNLYTNHSYLSFFGLLNYVLSSFEKGENNKIIYKPGIIANREELLLAATVVLKHHSGLPDYDRVINDEEFIRMMKFLREGKYYPLHMFYRELPLDGSIKNFDFNLVSSNETHLEAAKSLFKSAYRFIEDPLEFFFNLKLTFSAVVSADKFDAGNQGRALQKIDDSYKKLLPRFKDRVQECCARLDSTMESNPKKAELNRVRTQIRNEDVARLIQAMREHPDQHTFSLTEPTGSGKTYILMALAAEVKREKFPIIPPKIIYSVPFLSITEQVYDIIIKQIFPNEEEGVKRIDCKADPGVEIDKEDEEITLLKKSMIFLRKIFKGQTPREEQVERALLMDYMEKTFDFPMIITTFVQVFQSLTTSTNKGLMRLAYLQDCIFLVDEIQALPPRLYSFLVALLDAFCKKCNSYAIISTATMPSFDLPTGGTQKEIDARHMFRDYSRPIEIGNAEHFGYAVFNRYIIHTIREDMTVAKLTERILQETKATMVVLNTIADSRNLCSKLKTSNPGCPVLLLNTLLHSNGRTKIIEDVKELLKTGQRFYLITTQVVEAGVDIDFDVVFRDIAPISNIIQTAGRCNRNGRLEWGHVYVFQLYEDDRKALRASYIYRGIDSDFLNYAIRRFFIQQHEDFQERDLFQIQREYFTTLNQNTEFGKWGKEDYFVSQIKEFKFNTIGHFSIIDKKEYGDQVQFYVPESAADQNYERLLNLYAGLEAFEALPSHEKGDTMRKIMEMNREIANQRKKMMGRVVQTNMKDETEIQDFSAYSTEPIFKLYKLKLNTPEKIYYDEEIGLMIRNKGDLYV